MKLTKSQSSLICQSCYTHLDDFHKFALLVKEKQESLAADIPTIKVEDSDDDQDVSYIRDTDVLVEFKTDTDLLMDGNEMNFPQDDLLMVSETMNEFHNNSLYADTSLSMSSFDQMPWLVGGRDMASK